MAETSADIKRREEQLRQVIEQLTERMKLRQWAVERAIETYRDGARVSLETTESANVMALARAIHAFITEPANDALTQLTERTPS